MTNRGFTLIELLVTMSIMAIVATIGSAGFRDFTARQEVDSLTRDIIGNLHAMQSDVSSGNKPAGCSGTLNGYRVSFDVQGGKATSYSISAVCSSDILIKTYSLSSTQYVTLNKPPVSGKVSFVYKTLDAGTDIPSASPLIISVHSNNTSRVLTITISSTGQIK